MTTYVPLTVQIASPTELRNMLGLLPPEEHQYDVMLRDMPIRAKVMDKAGAIKYMYKGTGRTTAILLHALYALLEEPEDTVIVCGHNIAFSEHMRNVLMEWCDKLGIVGANIQAMTWSRSIENHYINVFRDHYRGPQA